jgi:hypothetical protein
MTDPPGQTTTQVPSPEPGGASRTVISAAREVEQGARSVLLLVEGLFRLDVIPHDDTIQTLLRNLSPAPAARLRFGAVGGAASAGDELVLSTGRFGGEVVLIDGAARERPVARILVGSVCHLDRGLTSFTAQATLL